MYHVRNCSFAEIMNRGQELASSLKGKVTGETEEK